MDKTKIQKIGLMSLVIIFVLGGLMLWKRASIKAGHILHMEQECNAGKSNSCFKLGSLYSKGKIEIKAGEINNPDPIEIKEDYSKERAERFYIAACNSKYGLACSKMYEENINWDEPFLFKGCDAGDLRSCELTTHVSEKKAEYTYPVLRALAQGCTLVRSTKGSSDASCRYLEERFVETCLKEENATICKGFINDFPAFKVELQNSLSKKVSEVEEENWLSAGFCDCDKAQEFLYIEAMHRMTGLKPPKDFGMPMSASNLKSLIETAMDRLKDVVPGRWGCRKSGKEDADVVHVKRCWRFYQSAQKRYRGKY
jgi:hypothetical protein